MESDVNYLKQEEMLVPDEVFLVDIEEEGKPKICFDGLIPLKHEKEIIVPDEDGLIRVQKEEFLDLDEGPEDSLNAIEETSFSVLESKLDPKEDMMPLDKGTKSYNCAQCDYETKSENRFKKHIKNRHTDEMFHKCPHCDYKSLKTSHLKSHIMARHTDEKPYECPHCEFKTQRTTNVKRHIMARHTGEKPHKCPQCDYKTIQFFTLKKHIMAHHTGEKPYHCSQCDYKTLHPNDLKVHIMIHHTGEKPFKCSECVYKSARFRDLKRHIKCRHAKLTTEQTDKQVERKGKVRKQRQIKDATKLPQPGSPNKITRLKPERATKAAVSIKEKRRKTSPKTSTPVAKKLKGVDGKSKIYAPVANGCRVVIVPSIYPKIQLSREQCEVLKEMITDKLDEIDETRDDHPSFNGISFKMGGCLVSCDNDASRTWLLKIIPDIIIEGGINLRTGDAKELVKFTNVGSFFPGKKLTEEALLKRLRVQNASIEDVRSWSLHFMKEMEKGFFAILRIPERSLKSLKAESMQVGYGLGKVTMKHLKNKKQTKLMIQRVQNKTEWP